MIKSDFRTISLERQRRAFPFVAGAPGLFGNRLEMTL
jgi:hypothetical protein